MTADKTGLALVPFTPTRAVGALGGLPSIATGSADYWRCRAAEAEQSLAESQARQTQLADGLQLAHDLLSELDREGALNKRQQRLLERVWACFSGENAFGDVPTLQSGPMLRSIASLVNSAMETGGASCVTFHGDSDEPEVVVVAAVGHECELLTYHLLLTERPRMIRTHAEEL